MLGRIPFFINNKYDSIGSSFKDIEGRCEYYSLVFNLSICDKKALRTKSAPCSCRLALLLLRGRRHCLRLCRNQHQMCCRRW